MEEIDQDQVSVNGNHPSRQSFSMTTPLKSKPSDQQHKYIQELEAQKRELEIKVFELSSGATDTKGNFFSNVKLSLVISTTFEFSRSKIRRQVT